MWEEINEICSRFYTIWNKWYNNKKGGLQCTK
jgi:hypothetical protein